MCHPRPPFSWHFLNLESTAPCTSSAQDIWNWRHLLYIAVTLNPCMSWEWEWAGRSGRPPTKSICIWQPGNETQSTINYTQYQSVLMPSSLEMFGHSPLQSHLEPEVSHRGQRNRPRVVMNLHYKAVSIKVWMTRTCCTKRQTAEILCIKPVIATGWRQRDVKVTSPNSITCMWWAGDVSTSHVHS